MTALDIEKDLLDDEGENRAVRAFLLYYGGGNATCPIISMREHLARSGFDGCWPASAAAPNSTTLTKAGAQLWLRHLFSLEPAAKRATQPAHETIISDGDTLVCTACGTTATQPATVPAQVGTDLIEAARAVVARWDSPKWKDQPHTAEFINRLRRAVEASAQAGMAVTGLTDDVIAKIHDAIPQTGNWVNDFARAIAAHVTAAGQRGEDAERKRHQAIGNAVERACSELPLGFDLHIELERDAGTVKLYVPDGYTSTDQFDADTFDEQINNAIDAAIAAKEGQDG